MNTISGVPIAGQCEKCRAWMKDCTCGNTIRMPIETDSTVYLTADEARRLIGFFAYVKDVLSYEAHPQRLAEKYRDVADIKLGENK